ncbi:MAG: DEAD/DEAH box helicase [Pirellulaceae bacterium]
MNFAARCRLEFDGITRSRGAEYADNGAVQIVDMDEEGLLADVEGSASEPYEVELDWSDALSGTMSVSCSCPRFADGILCKHLWAAILSVDSRGQDHRVPGRQTLSIQFAESNQDEYGNYDDVDDDVDDSNGIAGFLGFNSIVRAFRQKCFGAHDTRRIPPSSPKSSKSSKPVGWKKAFQTLNHSGLSQVARDPWDHFQRRDRVAWYLLHVGSSASEGHVIIDLLQQERMKNGELGKVKSLSFQDHMVDEFDDPADRQLLQQLQALSHDTYGYRDSYYRTAVRASLSRMQVSPAVYGDVLPRLAASGRFVWMLDGSQPFSDALPVAWDAGDPWTFELVITPDDAQQRWSLSGRFMRGEEARPMSDVMLFVPTGLVLFPGLLCRVGTATTSWINWIYQQPQVVVPYKDREVFLRALWQSPALPPIAWPDNLALQQVREVPRPRIRVRQPERQSGSAYEMTAEVDFLYGETTVRGQEVTAGIVQSPTDRDGPLDRVILRDREAEEARIKELGELPVALSRSYGRQSDSVRIRAKQLPSIVDQLLASGWQVEAEGKLYRTSGDFRLQVQSGIDWFDLDATMDFGGVEAKLPELLAALRRGQKYVELGDGTRGLLPDDWLHRYTSLADLGEAQDGKVRFARSQALLLDALVAEQQDARLDQPFEEYRQRLQSFSGVSVQDAPQSFQGTLRDYQRHGLGWFRFLDDLGLGGCLADDMGLGKTVQVLAMLEQRRCRQLPPGETRRPSLVVVPKSLVFNWIDEAQRFTPQLRVYNYTGLQRAALRDEFDHADLVVTTYGTLRRDIVELKERSFDYVILDEAQAIKNAASQMAKASLLLQARRRLALSGTPIENHLGELWSLFEFLNPGMLGRSSAFTALCKATKADDRASLCQLARAVAPFIFRRTKEQVLKELPEKTEQTLYCDLTPKERHDYDQLKTYYRAKLSNVIDERGLEKSKIHVLEALLRLRQAACHPGLIDPKKAQGTSTKVDLLLEQLEEVIGEGHKALVFSQFTSLLAIVRQKLDSASIRYEYLDGKTRNRKAVVQRFQTDASCPVFLISLKAGGHGLNLTAADYVFILDPWWNPAVEMQAIDRTHRIGQTRRVFAYRIIARDTVEEKVITLQNSKRELADAIITANDSLIRKLTADDLQLILS